VAGRREFWQGDGNYGTKEKWQGRGKDGRAE